MHWKDLTSAYTWIPAHTTEIKTRVPTASLIKYYNISNLHYLGNLIFCGLKNEGYFNARWTVTWLNKSGGRKKPEILYSQLMQDDVSEASYHYQMRNS